LHFFGKSSLLRATGLVLLAISVKNGHCFTAGDFIGRIPELRDQRHGFMGFSDIAKAFRRVASMALLLSYSSSAAQSTWLEKGALRLPVHGACIDSESS
jgi:hypothetical protein